MSLLIVAILLCLTDLAKLEAGVEFGHSAKSRALTGLEKLLHEARSSSNAKGSDCSQEVVNVARAFTSEMMAQMSKKKQMKIGNRKHYIHYGIKNGAFLLHLTGEWEQTKHSSQDICEVRLSYLGAHGNSIWFRLATEGRLTLLHNHRNCLDQPSAPLSIHMLASGHLLFAGPLEKFTSFGFIYVLNLGQKNAMGRREGRK